MGWRFRKRIKLFPGIYMNISKSGIGFNFGIKGASITTGSTGTYVNTGISGTGLYRRDKINSSSSVSTEFHDNQSLIEEKESNNYHKPLANRNISKSPIKSKITKSELADSVDVGTIVISQVDSDPSELEPYNPRLDLSHYEFPTLGLLRHFDFDIPKVDVEEIQGNKNRIVELLRSFGLELSTISCKVGPRFTIYEIRLAPGLNAKELYGLEDDIAMALRSSRVRIAPIPENGTIGIEVANIKPMVVSMESVLGSKFFQESIMELPCAIGKTNTNEVYVFDLAKAPHVLIAGSSGQGKSVALNVIITSLLYKKHPSELKLVLMDPLGTELGLYSQIYHHFLASLPYTEPVITRPSAALNTLTALCREMEARYRLLSLARERDVKSYNMKFKGRRLNPALGHRFLPYIVVAIDSYSALSLGYEERMMYELTKLVEGARAVGIHVVIATKRPTSDIISSEMKSFIPTRISFSMPEAIDSQVILDCDGAEELAGPGDMLFKNKQGMVRIQCAYIDTLEVDNVNIYISNQQGYSTPFYLPEYSYDEENHSSGDDVEIERLDSLFEDAARLLVIHQVGSTSLIQRKFSIGYNRAGRIMDQLEWAGILGPANGSAPREVLIHDEERLEILFSQLFKD